MPWVAIALFAVSLVFSFLLTPKPKTNKIKPANEIDVPQTKTGREIPIIFGTVIVRDPNVVWFGDMKVKAVKKKGGKK